MADTPDSEILARQPSYWELGFALALGGGAFWAMHGDRAFVPYGAGLGLVLFLGRMIDWQRSAIRGLEERIARLEQGH